MWFRSLALACVVGFVATLDCYCILLKRGHTCTQSSLSEISSAVFAVFADFKIWVFIMLCNYLDLRELQFRAITFAQQLHDCIFIGNQQQKIHVLRLALNDHNCVCVWLCTLV